MSRSSFDSGLLELHNDLIKMCGLIEEAIAKSIKSLENSDHQLALSVVENDKQIDEMESAIESLCLRLILRQQPVAKDLRVISTAIKMITDMERIGDQASDIAEISTRFAANTIIPPHIMEMSKIAINMVNESIRAFIDEDIELARSTMQMDDDVDNLFIRVKDDVIDFLRNSQDSGDDAINLMMIAKYLERIGDHAVNICEWVEFCETGIHKDRKIL